MTIDLQAVRTDTPGCKNKIHLNNAGAALSPQVVLDAVKNHLDLEAQIGGYEAADQAQEAYHNTYLALAAMLNCKPDEVALIENATRAWDMVFYAFPFQTGDRILTDQTAYAANYVAFLQVAKRTGAVIQVIPSDSHGQVCPQALSEMLDDRVKLVSICHIPTNGGLINPADRIGRITAAAGIPFLLDACQSAGQLPLDVTQLQCDMLTATGRKYLRGPRGTGFLYIKESLANQLEPPFLDLHAATWTAADQFQIQPGARRFETWEGFVAGKIGLGAAVDYAMALGLENIAHRVNTLAQSLRSQLRRIKGVTVHDLGVQQCGIVTLTVDGFSPAELKPQLQSRGVNTSVTDRESTRLDMEARNLKSMLRASVHYYNTEDELAEFCRILSELIN